MPSSLVGNAVLRTAHHVLTASQAAAPCARFLFAVCCLQLEEQQRLDAEAAAVAAAEAAALAVQLEYEASLPDDIKQKVAAVLEREEVSGVCSTGRLRVHKAFACIHSLCLSKTVY